jgi:gamma-glutamylputrescine oxidase
LAAELCAPTLYPEQVAFDRNESYWSDELPPPYAPLTTDLEVDVAIVGGGYTGLSAAYYLASLPSAPKVIVLEAMRCGNGASGRNGAMVLNLKMASAQSGLSSRLYELTVENTSRIRALSAALNFNCELELAGAMTTLRDEAEIHQALSEVEEWRRVGLPLEFWNRAKTTAALGTKAYTGGVFDPNAGQVHPGKLVGLWKAAAVKMGAKIHEGTPVHHILEGRVHVLSTTAGHEIRAHHLVLATNAYTSKLGYLRWAVAPITNYVAVTRPLTRIDLQDLGWTSRIPFNDTRREVYYAGCTQTGRIHFGGGRVDYEFNNGMHPPDHRTLRISSLHEEFARVFPSLKDVPFERHWFGFVDVSLDQEPSVGRVGKYENVYYGLGYSGEGVNLSSVFGRIIADLIDGKAHLWEWFPLLSRRFIPVPNEPLRWPLIQSELAIGRLFEH